MLPKGPSHTKKEYGEQIRYGEKKCDGNSQTLRRVLRSASLSRQKRQENGTDKRARARARVRACLPA